ncbi:oligosaccharide flippase family protein [Bifidobacterium eulemuris]|uniref:Oligosaccharide flippase family protein n=1 Tax=Bifidobacterium eulemuris TaxID=1765219 RepID=A0A261G587_9BIFI|nr:oligosaccharide flippase family protein [Bifidobacterium eulemuris]OZG66568.1 polysaccharide biosynthesis protein [Bifidobacterium eulemuris]QOL32651.1 oligosaccharide flippase family protein [Bifidobacterium eulemuris]
MASIKKNFLYASAYKLLELLLPLITSPLLSRRLGAEGLGAYSYSYAIVSLFVMVAELGLYRYGMREIAKAKTSQDLLNQTFSDIFATHVVNAAIVITAYYMIAPLLWGNHPWIFMIQGLSIVGNMIDNAFLFVGMENMRPLVARDTTVKIVTFILIVILVQQPSDLLLYIVIMCFSSLTARSIALWYGRHYVSFVKPSVSNCLRHYRGMFKLMVPVVAEGVYNNIGKLMVGSLFSKSDVGYMELSSKATTPKTIIASLGTVMCPNIARMHAEGKHQQVRSKFIESFTACMAMSYAVAFGISAVAPEFAPWFWGQDFAFCAPLMTGFAISIPFWTVGEVIRNQYLLPTGKDNQYMAAFLIGVGSLSIFCILLVPRFGALGAVTSTICAEAVMSIAQTLFIRGEVPVISPLLGTLPYLCCGAFMLLDVRLFASVFSIDAGFQVLAEICIGILTFVSTAAIYEAVTKRYLLLRVVAGTLKTMRSR